MSSTNFSSNALVVAGSDVDRMVLLLLTSSVTDRRVPEVPKSSSYSVSSRDQFRSLACFARATVLPLRFGTDGFKLLIPGGFRGVLEYPLENRGSSFTIALLMLGSCSDSTRSF